MIFEGAREDWEADLDRRVREQSGRMVTDDLAATDAVIHALHHSDWLDRYGPLVAIAFAVAMWAVAGTWAFCWWLS
jgi:hypothetical protein